MHFALLVPWESEIAVEWNRKKCPMDKPGDTQVYTTWRMRNTEIRLKAVVSKFFPDFLLHLQIFEAIDPFSVFPEVNTRALAMHYEPPIKSSKFAVSFRGISWLGSAFIF